MDALCKKIWRIFKYILGFVALLCAVLVLWWLDIEGVFLSDLKDTKARIANSAHFKNGVAQNFEPNESNTAPNSKDLSDSDLNKAHETQAQDSTRLKRNSLNCLCLKFQA